MHCDIVKIEADGSREISRYHSIGIFKQGIRRYLGLLAFLLRHVQNVATELNECPDY